jgi:uncharacterized protein
MTQTFKLYRLQQIDSQMDQARARVKEIEAALSKDEALRKAQESADAAARQLEVNRKALHKAEEDVLAQRVKIEQNEATLYGGKVRNPKELQDLQNEIAALKRYLGVLEDRQLEVMITIEESEQVSEQAKAALRVEAARNAEENEAMLSEHAVLQSDLARQEGERQAAVSGIDAADLGLYEQLRLTRRGVAVSKVNLGACQACGSTLSAALLHAARSPAQITRCELCGRILYGG